MLQMFLLLLSISTPSFAQNEKLAGGATCGQMQAFCPSDDGTNYEFEFLSSNIQETSCNSCNFGCLSTHPGEQWLYFQVTSSGNLQFTTSSANDHDYAVWGPYDNKAAAIQDCNSLAMPKDCSFNSQSSEVINLGPSSMGNMGQPAPMTSPGALAGKTYIMVLTNYAKTTQDLITSVGGSNTAGFDCSDIVAQPSAHPSAPPSSAPSSAPSSSAPSSAPTAEPILNETRCECWYNADVIACPIVRQMLDFECGGGTGSYEYICSDEQIAEENSAYLLWNFLPVLYKIVFFGCLHVFLGCRKVDLGLRNVACWRLNNATIFLILGNVCLVLFIYLSRCFWPVWAFFMIIWLHFDICMCLLNRHNNKMGKAPPPPEAPRSNLELFAYTNHKKSWKEKAYETVELGKHKKSASIAKKIEVKIEKKKAKLMKGKRTSYHGSML